MSTAFDDIREAFETALAAYQDTNVAWPNTTYKRVNGTPFLEPTFVPGESVQAGLGTNGKNRQTGVYQVTVWDQAGIGSGALIQKADEIITVFKRGTDLINGSVTVRISSSWMGGIEQDGDWAFLNITVLWYADTTN